MMRILHTSDWHLGHSLCRYDRSEEQTAMLRQIRDIVEHHRPDVMLVAGDIYHNPHPSAGTQMMLADALVDLHELHPEMRVVITAGNHDSAARHEIFRQPWRRLGVHAIGNIGLPDDHIIEIPGRGYVVAVPYAHERNIPPDFFRELLDEVTRRNTDNRPVVMTAHLTISGCDYSGHERSSDMTAGGIDSRPLSDLGRGYDYLALGHIHRRQTIPGSDGRARYCGTPLPVSFDETGTHVVFIVDLHGHGISPSVTGIEINNPHPLVTLPTSGFTGWEQAKKLLTEFPDDIPAYLRLNVETEDFLPAGAEAEAREIAGHKQGRFCYINVRRKESHGNPAAGTISIQEFREEAPVDIARRYAADAGIIFDDEMESMFNEIVADL